MSEAPTQTNPARARWTALDWLVVALVLAPYTVGIVAVLTGIGSEFHSTGDDAINELRIRDIGTHAVLLGPYSRDGWSHLGPAMYYALVGPYRALGSHSSGLLVGALLINGASALGVVTIARRVGGRTIMLVLALAMSVVAIHLGAEFLRDPWNPHLPVLPFGLLIIACWGLACGRIWLLPVVALVASFCAQTHVGYIPIAAALVAWGLVGALATMARPPEPVTDARSQRRTARNAAFVTVVLLAVMWTPPIIDQVTDRGNLNAARIYFTRAAPTRGFDTAARVVGEEFTLTPDWLFGREPPVALSVEPPSATRTPLPFLAAAFLAVLFVTWRRQDRAVRQLAVGMVILGTVSILALARTPGLLYDYRLRWLWLVGAMTAATTLWMGLRVWCSRERPQRIAQTVVLAGLVLVGIGAAVAGSSTRPPRAAFARSANEVSAQVLDHLPKDTDAVVVRAATFGAYGVLNGLVLRLEQAGITARVDASKASDQTFGRHRTDDGHTSRSVLTVAVDETVIEAQRVPDRFQVAYVAHESAEQQVRDSRELARLVAKIRAGDRSARTQRRIHTLAARRSAIAVFLSIEPPASELPASELPAP